MNASAQTISYLPFVSNEIIVFWLATCNFHDEFTLGRGFRYQLIHDACR